MLYLVLGLVLAAFGLLIAALTTANTLFAWVSVTVSVIAAGALVADWLSGRRRAREAAEEAEPDPVLTRPEQPLGDQTPPLTETRRGTSRRAGRAAAREERAALRAEAAVREEPAALREEAALREDEGPGLEEAPAEAARQAEHGARPEPVAGREPAARESGVGREPAVREPAAPHEPPVVQESAWDFEPERERGRGENEPAAAGAESSHPTEPDPADVERAGPALAALPRDDRPADRPDDRSPDREADRTDRPADRAPERAADQPAEPPVERSPDRPADRAADRAPDRAPDQAAEQPADRVPDQDPDRVAERSEGQAPGRAAEKPADREADRAVEEDRAPAERTAVLSGRRAEEARRTVVDEHGEPGEEPTDAADLLIVTDLQSQVRVVDEHPRYHLATCPFLHDKPTIPLPVAEARQLGFTPCIRCGPDATLAAQHRATR